MIQEDISSATEDYNTNPLLITVNLLKEQINIQKQAIYNMTKQLKIVEKHLYKNIKISEKVKEKQVKNKPRKTGLTKPMNISQELSDFINTDVNTKVARTDVTKRISAYIKDNNLQNPLDKRIIIPNESLKKLFEGYDDTHKLSYFNLQRFISHHYSN